MTPEEYIIEHNVKPLTEAEKKKGKSSMKIFGTDDPMPWDEIYTRIAAGMEMDHIAHIYGHGRKIALWAVHDGISVDPVMSDLLDSEIEQRTKMAAVANTNPEVAQTLHNMANEYAPDSAKKVAVFSDRLVDKATDLLKGQKVTSLDLVNLTKAVQTASDILGHTQRHASASSHTTNNIRVDGFTFVEDLGPNNYIEGEIDENK